MNDEYDINYVPAYKIERKKILKLNILEFALLKKKRLLYDIHNHEEKFLKEENEEEAIAQHELKDSLIQDDYDENYFEDFNYIREKADFEEYLFKNQFYLLDFQKDVLKWISEIKQNKQILGGVKGAILSIPMGCGKTFISLCEIAKSYELSKTPSLIITPKSVIKVWEDEINKFYSKSSMPYYVIAKKNDWQLLNYEKLMQYKIVIISIDQLFAMSKIDIKKNYKIYEKLIVRSKSGKHSVVDIQNRPVPKTVGELKFFNEINQPMFSMTKKKITKNMGSCTKNKNESKQIQADEQEYNPDKMIQFNEFKKRENVKDEGPILFQENRKMRDAYASQVENQVVKGVYNNFPLKIKYQGI